MPAVRAGFLIALALGTGSSRLDSWFGQLGFNRVAQHNEEYLKSSFDRSVRIFGVLSIVKVGLAVVEGTQVGVGFGLEVGDVVQAAYDYINTAWYVVMAGGVILLGIQYLLSAATHIDHLLLMVALFLFAGAIVIRSAFPTWKTMRRILYDAGLFAGLLSAAVYLLFPLSVRGGAFLSKTITRPSLEEVESGVVSMKQDLFEQGSQSQGIVAAWRQSKERLQKVTVYLKDKTSQMVLWILKLITAYLFDCIVFPLMLFALFYWFARGCLRYLFRVTDRKHLKEDLVEVLRGEPTALTQALPRREGPKDIQCVSQ